MKFTGQYKHLALMAGIAPIVFSGGSALAQTKTIDVDVDVQNTLTLTVVEDLNFGKIVAVSAAANTATEVINADTGVVTFATTGGTALMVMIDATNKTAAQVTIEDFADGATINVTINNVTDPVEAGGKAFTLSAFSTSFNGGADTARTAGTPWTQTVSAAFNGGVNTLDIGATLKTLTTVATYPDGNYDGAFDVVFSY